VLKKILAVLIAAVGLCASTQVHAQEQEYVSEYELADYEPMDTPDWAWNGKNNQAPAGGASTRPLGKVAAGSWTNVTNTYVSKQDKFGNDQWGAGYDFSISSRMDTDTWNDKVSLTGTLGASVTVFGWKRDVVRVEASAATNLSPARASAKAGLYLFGFDAWEESLPIRVGQIERERAFIDLHQPITVIPPIDIPVFGLTLRVSAKVVLNEFVKWRGLMSPNGVDGAIIPGYAVTGRVEASIGQGVRVFIAGDINLVRFSMPVEAKLYGNIVPNNAGCRHSLTLAERFYSEGRSLSGSIKAGMKADFWPFRKGKSMTLYSWGGKTEQVPFHSSSRSMCM
jgi:hypothetical protein